MLIVKLPFPDMRLSQNQKSGKRYRATIAPKKAQRSAAYMLTKAALTKTGPFEPKGENIPLSLLFVTPDRRKRDTLNMADASKALIDGMADALGIDDSRFKPVLVDWVHGSGDGALIAAVGVHIISGMALNDAGEKAA